MFHNIITKYDSTCYVIKYVLSHEWQKCLLHICIQQRQRVRSQMHIFFFSVTPFTVILDHVFFYKIFCSTKRSYTFWSSEKAISPKMRRKNRRSNRTLKFEEIHGFLEHDPKYWKYAPDLFGRKFYTQQKRLYEFITWGKMWCSFRDKDASRMRVPDH